MFHPLITHIKRFVPLSEGEEQAVVSHFKHQEVGKKKFVLSEGDVCPANWFILKGCLRMYFIKDNGHENIVQFGIDNWWITDYMSLDSQRPSPFFIQAVEASEVAVLSRASQEDLLAQVPAMERYFRLILQRHVGALTMRMRYWGDMTQEERYHHFAGLFPEFIQRIPQYMLASYLGFTPEFLSRIRAKK